jgi:uncharacterized damage-inducible protein DinB
MNIIVKPTPAEFPPYAAMYIDLVPTEGNLLIQLEKNFETVKELICSLPGEKLYFRYAPGKWTIKEILVHIIDDERIYAYRALRFARRDQTELPGFEQDDYAVSSKANERDLDNIFEEYEAVRRSTISLFNGLPPESLTRKGTANNHVASVRALAWHIAGHELHHLAIIKEKYL